MKNPALLGLFWLLTVAAAPPTRALPVPPIPPAAPPPDRPAPVPDIDAHGPAEAAPGSVRLAPSLFRRDKTYPQGEGYMPGSSFKDRELERDNKPSPGLNLRMTLP